MVCGDMIHDYSLNINLVNFLKLKSTYGEAIYLRERIESKA